MPPTTDSFLANYPHAISQIAFELRGLIFEVYPRANERLNFGWRTISYGVGPSMADQICYIAPLSSSVNLGFMRGTALADPEQALKGIGQHLRHIKFVPFIPIPRATVLSLLQAAFPVNK